MSNNNKKIRFLFINLFVLVFILSCNKSKNSIVDDWYQKKIQIPEGLNFKSIDHDTKRFQVLSHKFKILYYLDSLGCTTCRLKLSAWKSYIDSCKFRGYDVGFIFVVEVRKVEEFENKLFMHHFTYPIIYDPNGEFDKINKLPKEEKFRTFLLDARNRVILIGSPITNDKIRKLYSEILGGGKISNIDSFKKMDSKSSSINQTSVQLNKNSVDLGKFSFKTTKHATFLLENTGKQTLIIQSVKTSCGCTVAKYDKKPIPVGQTATVMLEYKPNEIGYFSKTAVVVCNVPEGYVQLKISGEVVEN